MPHHESFDLARLAARAQKGDRAAFEKIVQGTARMVYAQIVLCVRDRQKAEDIAQETFLAAWKGIAAWRAGEGESGVAAARGFVAWLQMIARNTTLDAIKRERRIKRGGGMGRAQEEWKHAGMRAGEGTDEHGAGARKKPAEGSGGSAGMAGELADPAPEPAEAAAVRESRERALRLLEELPEEYRRVLSMRYLAGADYAAIREQLGISDGALRGLLNRGMAILRERMTRVGEI